jgi:hypothetical protein
MKNTALLMFLIIASHEAVACQSPQPLSGTVKVPVCLTDVPDCRPAGRVLHEYTEAQPDDPASFSIALQSSPWRLYGPDYRIVTVEEVAAIIRSQLEPKHKRVDLFGSWTGGTSSAKNPTLASRLSQALDGFPVNGKDGFLWMDKKGGMRTTKQAFTMREGGGPYSVPTGAEVFVPLAVGWAAGIEDRLGPDDHELMLLAGVGNDVFLLCPDGALTDFEAAAKMGNAIAAYNAALVRLERNQKGDRDAALKLLERAAQLGDDKASTRLEAMRKTATVPAANNKQ